MLVVFAAALGSLIPITNPIASVAAYAGLSSGMSARAQHRQAWATGAYVAGILVVFAVLGTLILSAFGITLAALQIAGGLVVMFSGFQLLLHGPASGAPAGGSAPPAPGSSAASAGTTTTTAKPKSIAFSPMALPLIAGPGAIGVVIGLTARHPGFADRVGVVLAALAIGGITAIVLRYGTPLVDRIGPAAIDALTRVMGFLILAIGAELVVHGALAAFPALKGS